MTIFDSIRYPISYPPTQTEINSLSSGIFAAWFKKLCKVRPTHHMTDEEKYNILRKVIAEYEE